ncbi:MAG: cation:proton antiporter [Planctomycetia bacterium]|nr:cation:proton antiporter [Planctomycetia bacterium]
MFLADLLIVFAVATVVVFAFGQARVPSVVGLLVAGVLVGPYGLSLVSDVKVVELLAEIGVVVLLFTVGLEFSMSRLVTMLPLMARIGLPQVVGTTLLVAAGMWWYLGTLPQAIFAGLLVAMSSTAIVLKLLADRSETAAPHGRITVAVLLLQDLFVVAAMLAVPALAAAAGVAPTTTAGTDAGGSHSQSPFTHPLAALAAGGAVLAGVLLAGRLVVPRVLHEVVRLRNRELFLMTIVLVCLGTAAVTAQVGLSLALGAFLAGLALADSEYGHQAFTEVLPFRDTLASLFFVSVGMLLDVRFLVAHAGLVAATVLAIIAVKSLATVARRCRRAGRSRDHRRLRFERPQPGQGAGRIRGAPCGPGNEPRNRAPGAGPGPRHPLRRLHPRGRTRARRDRTGPGSRGGDLRSGEQSPQRAHGPRTGPRRADLRAHGARLGGR